MTETNQNLEDIWKGDLLGRREEAELLVAYIESLSTQPQFREDAKAFTIAVDAGYGEGKTWFLKRLSKELAINHPVAFIDAWQDDLADEPLTALVATLKKALAAYFPKQTVLKSKFDVVIEKSGRVAKIAGKGLLKRAIGLAITTEAVAASAAILSGASNAVQDAVQDSLKAGGQELVDDSASVLEKEKSIDLMKGRIADFEAGQKAIRDLKASLEDVVDSLDCNTVHPPIVIIIDELDRCRPTYAIKLLEEVKHLFDVPGLVFIFGLNRAQLAESAVGAYGGGFDGQAYLSRFIHRHYRLKLPPLEQFIRYTIKRCVINTSQLCFPQGRKKSGQWLNNSAADMIGFYLRAYSCSVRDSITVIEMLQTCCAVAPKKEFFMPLLLPLLLSKLKGAEKGVLVQIESPEFLELQIPNGSSGSTPMMQWQEVAAKAIEFIKQSLEETQVVANDPDIGPLYRLLLDFQTDEYGRIASGYSLFDPANYSDLIETVGRFSSPPVGQN